MTKKSENSITESAKSLQTAYSILKGARTNEDRLEKMYQSAREARISAENKVDECKKVHSNNLKELR